jgi:hypothetical protein
LGLVFNTSPIVLPAPDGISIGTASGTFLLQEATRIVMTAIIGSTNFMEFDILFMISFFMNSMIYGLENVVTE